ncbi:MAG: TlpA disulfide reductase family protein [Anaerolineales bacterium]
MRRIWKPLVLILVIGIMAADVFFDQRAIAQSQTEAAVQTDLDLPVGTKVGELAPNFTGTTLDGETIRLSDLRGKTVLINVFASWCGPCRLEMPHLVEAADQFGDQKVVFIGINLQENPEAVEAFRDEFNVQFPLVLKKDGSLTNNLYTPIGLPTSWFIDQDGVVRYVFAGAMTREVLQNVLDDVIAGREPDPFRTSG